MVVVVQAEGAAEVEVEVEGGRATLGQIGWTKQASMKPTRGRYCNTNITIERREYPTVAAEEEHGARLYA